MDTNPSGAPPISSRLMMLAALSSGAAILWFLLSVVMGATSANAADDARGPRDALGESLGSVVSQATAPVADLAAPPLEPVAQIVAPVADTLAPVIDTVAPAADTVAPVAAHVAPVVADVTEPLEPVLGPLDDVVESVTAPLEPVVAPVAEVVHPVTDVAAPIVDAVAPALPAVPGILPGGSSPTSGAGETPASTTPVPAPVDAVTPLVLVGVTASTVVAETARAFAEAVALSGAAPAFSTTLAATAGSLIPDLFGPAPGHPFGPAPDSTTFFSSGPGSATGMSAVLALGLLAAHRAWVLRRRPGDESALPTPILGVDVSPD